MRGWCLKLLTHPRLNQTEADKTQIGKEKLQSWRHYRTCDSFTTSTRFCLTALPLLFLHLPPPPSLITLGSFPASIPPLLSIPSSKSSYPLVLYILPVRSHNSLMVVQASSEENFRWLRCGWFHFKSYIYRARYVYRLHTVEGFHPMYNTCRTYCRHFYTIW